MHVSICPAASMAAILDFLKMRIFNISLSISDPVPRLWTRLQQSDNGVSHFHLVSGSLDMKNHRGACLSGGHEIRYRPNPIWPPSAIMKFQLFYFLE